MRNKFYPSLVFFHISAINGVTYNIQWNNAKLTFPSGYYPTGLTELRFPCMCSRDSGKIGSISLGYDSSNKSYARIFSPEVLSNGCIISSGVFHL